MVQDAAPPTRTVPEAGWNRLMILAVPLRTYSCGWRAGFPSGRHEGPGCGTVWNGPASSSHHTGKPSDSPNAYASSISFFWARRRGR